MGTRLRGGAGAQLVANLALVIIQVGTISVLLPVWGTRVYGGWLVLSAVPTYIALSELGLFSAAAADMTMAVARGQKEHARDVFQAISRGVGAIFVMFLIAVPVFARFAPVGSWLHVARIGESTVAAILVMFALRTLLISYAGLIYGGFAAVGRYGEGVMYMTGITFAEFLALVATALLGYGPGVAAAAMLACRVVGDGAMYAAMRRRTPWLRFGQPRGRPRVIRRLLRPGLASAAIGSGIAINIQGMVVLVGVVTGPASVAIFSTIRTMTRVVIQLLSSISETVGPELAKAYGENNHALLRNLQRRASQAALWTATPLLFGLAIFGGPILHIWTQGRVSAEGLLIYLFLIAAGIDIVWFTCGGILVWTNRHSRVALIYIIASVATLGLAYGMLEAWGLDGGAGSLIALELVMLVVVLRQSLPAAHDTVRGWATSIIRPPVWALRAMRSHFAYSRGAP